MIKDNVRLKIYIEFVDGTIENMEKSYAFHSDVAGVFDYHSKPIKSFRIITLPDPEKTQEKN